MSNQDYFCYQQLLTFPWHCPLCLVRELPFYNCSAVDNTVSDDSISSVASSDTGSCSLSNSDFPWPITLLASHLMLSELFITMFKVFCLKLPSGPLRPVILHLFCVVVRLG